ncbi:MAG: glycyl-radical enzyme activating protein [Oscillospiraceae bacterium]|nr:glycyl-radical enzyme activating protein [Oscillospiraceae bacterium]
MDGIVFSIEEFSIYDGPGIHTTVFLKGCPMRCRWCHNPEGQRPEPEIVRSPNGCLHCGACERLAEKTGERLGYTEESRLACPNGLLRRCGERWTVDALTARVLKCAPLLENGGVTFSGGEPLAQPEFLLACLDRLRGKLHTAVQTSGFAPAEVFDEVLQKADLFLFDLKLIDAEAHERWTGQNNAPILRNFRALAQSGVPYIPRVPLIPGVTDTEENLRAVASLLQEHGAKSVELLPYHRTAGGKYAMVGRVYDIKTPRLIQFNDSSAGFAA